MDQFVLLAKDYGPVTLLLSVLLFVVRLVFVGQLIPRTTHESQLTQMEKDRDYWRLTAEKWEKVAEGRIGLILDQQEAVTNLTGHVVKSIREAGTPDVVE